MPEIPPTAEYCGAMNCSSLKPCPTHNIDSGPTNEDLPPPAQPIQRRTSSLQDAGAEVLDLNANPLNEKKVFKELNNFTVKSGLNYYLLEANWYRQWCDYVQYESNEPPMPGKWDRPQAIDNKHLLLNGVGPKLRPEIREGTDFVILSKEAWAKLFSWYGGGPELIREAIDYGGRALVELHGLNLVIYSSQNPGVAALHLNMSARASVGKLKVRASQALGMDPTKVQLWDYFSKSPYRLFQAKDMGMTLEQALIMENNDILLEEPDKTGKYSMRNRIQAGGTGEIASGNVVTSTAPPLARGVVGLQNLGNTCFMNSTLQCISNVPLMREYFVAKGYEAEVNRENKLGHGGKLADTFADLLQLMWPTDGKTTVSCVAPRDFKFQIGTFAPQFAGYLQHDSSELLQFLLDGLHEDLNRVRTKPYVANPESKGRPDIEVAEEFQSVYRQRNNSKIVDIFCGQFKTTLVCPRDTCKNVAVLFEPYFSVPMPLMSIKHGSKSRFIVHVVRRKGQESKHLVMVEKTQRAAVLFDAITAATGLDKSKMVVCEFAKPDFLQSVFQEHKSLEYVRSNVPLYAFEVDDASVFLKERYEVGGKFKLHQRCECLFKGQWYEGSIVQAQPTYNGVVYSFKYDVDGLLSNGVIEEKLRFLAGTEPKVDENKNEQSGVVVYFYPSSTPRLFVMPLVCSEANVYATLAAELGVAATDFTLSVVNQYGPAPNPNKTETIRMAQRLYLGLTWNKGSDPRPSQVAALAGDEKDTGVFDLGKSFRMFQEVEVLSEQDTWFCGKCKNHVQAEKKMELWSAPPVLVLHLKRFSYTRYNRDKLEDFVQYPIEGLDVRPYLLGSQKESIYDLAAVSNHHGNLGFGHYTAYGRSSVDGHWYLFDDSSTRIVNPAEVVSEAGYILYYIRRDYRPQAWK